MIAIPEPSRTELVNALAAALTVAPLARSVNSDLLFQMQSLEDNNSDKYPTLRALVDLISKIELLEIFDDARQINPDVPLPVNHVFLAVWLVSRAQNSDPNIAICDLENYLDAEFIEIKEIFMFDGLKSDCRFPIGQYELTPWKHVPTSDTKHKIGARFLSGTAFPEAALARKHRVSRKHYRFWDQIPHQPMVSIEPAFDVLRCLTASIGVGLRPIGYYFEPPEWAPWNVHPVFFGIDQASFAQQATVSASQHSNIQSINACFLQKTDLHKARLRIPLDRLNRSYLAEWNPVNSAIELGIALEAIFAPQKISEGLAFAIRCRSAKFIGNSPEERKCISENIKKLYDLRSRAVHSGQFEATGAPNWMRDPTRVQSVMQKGRELVSASLAKLISEEEPDWEALDIGNT